jgi:hypothetical protein
MNNNGEKKPTALSQNILHVDALYNIKKKEIQNGLCRIGIRQSHLRKNGRFPIFILCYLFLCYQCDSQFLFYFIFFLCYQCDSQFLFYVIFFYATDAIPNFYFILSFFLIKIS